jgi:Flp pilus assembly protein TadG
MIPAGSAARRFSPARPERGYALVLVAISLVVLVIMAALAVDVGYWYNKSSRAQRAADSAALASITEYVKQRKNNVSVSNSQVAARNVAISVAKENGFDTANSNVTVAVAFTTGTGGADHVKVTVTQAHLPTFFSGIIPRNITVQRSSESAMSSCQAACNQSVTIQSSLGNMIDTGVGGDGWQAEIAGRYVFNLYHHMSGAVLYCTDKYTNAKCSVGTYPATPYTGMATSYTPKIAPVGTRAYFVVQTATSTGLGCWDGTTGAACTGFTTPKNLATYVVNPDKNAGTRIDGPELIGTRLFMYGDDNQMYCYDTATSAFCSGYPKAMSLSGIHDMKLVKVTSGFAGGVDGDGGIQFDMLVHPDGRIFTSLGPTVDSKIWLQCFDTTTGAPCTGWSNYSATSGRPMIYFTYATDGSPNGVCARSAKRGGGSGTGQECVTLAGASKATEVTFSFDSSSGQQEATGLTSSGHTVTFFPFTGAGASGCWDWATHAQCAISGSNWDKTTDYAYTYDGAHCIIGLGHEGYMWSFGVDDGQWPCSEAPAAGFARFTPCTCADGVTKRWTVLSLNTVTELNDFDSLKVTITLPDGSTWLTTDLVATGATSIDLRLLNSMSTIPAYVDVEIQAAAVPGHENEVFTLESDGMGLESGVVPTLVG